MLTLYDYLPSQNGYKVRLLLHHLGREYHTVVVSLFEGQGKQAVFLAKNPAGAIPVLELENGETLSESNAILCYLAEGTEYLPNDAWQRAQVLRWLFFEEDFIQNDLASLRYWTLTGKLGQRPAEVVKAKNARSLRSLRILNRWLESREFLANSKYSIADMSVYAYTAFGEEGGIPVNQYPAVVNWIKRVRTQPGFLNKTYPYSIDPHANLEL